MRIVRFTTFEELLPYSGQWNRICGTVPFRSWDWASTWWQYYGQHWDASRELFVLGVFDDFDNLVGLAPWYIERSVAFGRLARFLGSGEVCSDYLDVLSQPGLENQVAATLADWFAANLSEYCDRVEMTAIDSSGSMVEKLVEYMGKDVCTVHRRQGDRCWRIVLPRSVEEYVSRLSKNGRKPFHRIEHRLLGTGRTVLRTAQTAEEVAESMEILIDLHKRRFMFKGRQTSYGSERFWNFHRDLAQRMLRSGHLLLHVLDIDGVPAAAEYQFAGGGTRYAYQAGIDPDRLKLSPGRVIMVALVRWAISQGYHTLDLMRGDEAYKAHWRAKPHECLEIRIVPSRIAPQFRHSMWLAGTNTYSWLQEGVKQMIPTRNSE
ncbi:MAG: GNAT family N-acetyltransferase [Pirellulales bacterium]|nr:GNAT family N-acetyltransferase [Pirellulales bacterium]